MSAPFIIDPATGRVTFPDLTLELSPGMPEAAFVAPTARLNRDNLGANDGWQRYSSRGLIPGDRKLGLFLIFLNGCLDKVSFVWSQKTEPGTTGPRRARRRDKKNTSRRSTPSSAASRSSLGVRSE